MRRLNSFDAQFLAGEAANTLAHYAGLAHYEQGSRIPVLDRARLIAHVESRIEHIPPLRWRLKTVPLGAAHPVFVDGDVDVADHVYETTIDDTADELAVAAEMERILAEPMDRSRPLWEMHVIRGRTGNRVSVATKMHHAAADGLSAAMVFGMLQDEHPEGRTLEGTGAREDDPGGAELLVRGLLGGMLHPLEAAVSVPGALPHLDQLPILRGVPGVDLVAKNARRVANLLGAELEDPGPFVKAPHVRISGALSPQRAVAFGTVDLQLVKAAKAALGVTFNDVVIAAVAGALRRRLLEGDELPDDPLVAFVPANIRVDSDDPFGNAISSLIVPIPTHLEDPRERVAEAHRVLSAAKQRHKAVPSSLLSDANMLVPPALFKLTSQGVMALIGSGRVAPPVNLIVSNIPGPTSRLFLAGAPLIAHHPLSLVLAGVGLNLTVVSYGGQLDIGIVGDRGLMPDVWKLWEDLTAELEALQAQEA